MDNEVLSILNETGAWLPKGHYILVSGDHSSEYVNCRIPLGDERYRQTIARHLAELFESDHIGLVVGILPSGALMAPLVGGVLNVPALFAVPQHDSFRILGEMPRPAAKAVLILDDVLTMDRPFLTLRRCLEEKNLGTVKSFGVIVDRSGGRLSLGVHLRSLVTKSMDLYSEGACPICDQGIPAWDLRDPYMDPMRQIVSAGELGDRQVGLLYKYYADVYRVAGEPDRADQILRIPKEATLQDCGNKKDRVAVLGASKATSNIHDTAQFVARELGRYAITGKFIYTPKTGDALPFKHEPFESMNEHLRKMIFSSHLVLATHSIASGEIIETCWCSEALKPTLGLAFTKQIFKKPEPSCPYLLFCRRPGYVQCVGVQAIQDRKPVMGSWICKSLPRTEMCPFVEMDLSNMLLDFYCSNPRMTLIGSHSLENLKEPIRSFIENNGIFKPGIALRTKQSLK